MDVTKLLRPFGNAFHYPFVLVLLLLLGFAATHRVRARARNNVEKIMCGLVGYLDRKGNSQTPLGEILYKMTSGLCRRGPDSAGVALYGPFQPKRLKLRVKLGEQGDLRLHGFKLTEAVSGFTRVYESET